MDWNDIQAIVYDLDGTLYEDTQHFDFYAKELQSRLATDLQEAFWKEYISAKEDQHTLRIGRTYDVARDLILIQLKGVVQEAFQWDGTPLTTEEIQEFYPNGVTVNLENMLSVGDLWWVPSSVAYHFGLKRAAGQESFLATRAYMMTNDFQMNPIPGLQNAIHQAREKGILQILMTNSPEIDSEKILQKLGLSDAFNDKIFEAKKPVQTKEVLTTLLEKYDIQPEKLLSVGDNWVNEIWPAYELGCQTVLLDPHQVGDELEAHLHLPSIQDFVPILQSMKP